APTVPEFVQVYFGLHAAGVTVITMNTMSTRAEIAYVVEDSQASLMLAWHECADAAKGVATEVGIAFWEVETGAHFSGPPLERPYDANPSDTAVVLYTSGTTGRPKGAELTASNLIETTECFKPVLNLTSKDRFGTALPLFHVFGQGVVMN